MRLHLPFSLRKSVLSSLVSMVALSLGCGSACAVTESEPQNLVFDGATLTWNTDTENKVFTNAVGESASFAPGDNVTFASDASVSLGEDISAGQINIANGADVVIELADNGLNFDTLSMLGGSLDAGDSLNIAAGETLAVGSNGSVLKSDLVLEKNAGLSVDYAGTGSATSLNNSALSLQGGTRLQLSGCGNGDGKTYTLLTGVSELKDAKGNAISLNSTNNAIAKYFDTSQPGTGFWAGAKLELTDDGTLQLVRHNQAVKEAVEITARLTGGVNYQYYAGVLFENIEYVSSDSNAYGGAISVSNSGTINLSNNGRVEFLGNTVVSTSSDWSSGYGGAIYAGWECKTIKINSNGSVRFIGNSSVVPEPSGSHGGAISAGDNCHIELNNNGIVEFIANTSKYNGAIGCGSITLSNNERVTFRENVAQYAASAIGAICLGESLLIINNNIVEFEDNCGVDAAIYLYHGGVDGLIADNGHVRFAGNTGGAIHIGAGNTLSINNNQDVIFEKNVIIRNGSYNLRSLWADSSDPYNGNCKVYLSAAAENQIEFRDSIYIGSATEVKLNECYTATSDWVRGGKLTGDIIFTGKYTEMHLNELLSDAGENRKATEREILNSCTSEVYAMTNLYGGRLRVEDGAIYKGYGITAHADSDSTVRVIDATLNHTGYELHFFEGTTLEALGESEIFGDVIVESTATAAFSALTRLEGSLTLASGSELSLDGALTLNGALNLGTSLTLSGDILGLVKQLQAGQSLTLMVGLDSLAVQSSEQLRSVAYTEVESGQSLLASDYFSNLDADSEFLLLYDGAVGSLSISSGKMIPEPATTTLSLLALTALMSRRRRK